MTPTLVRKLAVLAVLTACSSTERAAPRPAVALPPASMPVHEQRTQLFTACDSFDSEGSNADAVAIRCCEIGYGCFRLTMVLARFPRAKAAAIAASAKACDVQPPTYDSLLDCNEARRIRRNAADSDLIDEEYTVHLESLCRGGALTGCRAASTLLHQSDPVRSAKNATVLCEAAKNQNSEEIMDCDAPAELEVAGRLVIARGEFSPAAFAAKKYAERCRAGGPPATCVKAGKFSPKNTVEREMGARAYLQECRKSSDVCLEAHRMLEGQPEAIQALEILCASGGTSCEHLIKVSQTPEHLILACTHNYPEACQRLRCDRATGPGDVAALCKGGSDAACVCADARDGTRSATTAMAERVFAQSSDVFIPGKAQLEAKLREQLKSDRSSGGHMCGDSSHAQRRAQEEWESAGSNAEYSAHARDSYLDGWNKCVADAEASNEAQNKEAEEKMAQSRLEAARRWCGCSAQ